MPGFLDGYGVAEARRERILKGIVLVSLAVLVVGGILYFVFRDYREEGRVKTFLHLLEQKDYKGAYALWGCTVAKPCPGYSYEKFLQDWGPKSDHRDAAAAEITRKRSCSEGVIETLQFPGTREVWLWVGRKDLALGFAPWPVCNPRLPKSEIQGP